MKLNRVFCTLALSALVLGFSANAANSTYNFRFSPLGLLVGGVSADLDIAMGSNWTLGPSIGYFSLSFGATGTNTSSASVKVISGGARANWHKNGVYTDGLYVGPFANFTSATATSGSASGTGSGFYIGSLVGYGWFWDSFNMLLGGGIAVPLGNQKVKVTDSLGNTTEYNMSGFGSLALEWTLGWTF